MLGDKTPLERWREFHVTGIPGSGKTALAMGLTEAFGGVYVQASDGVREVDPKAVVEGRMADETAIRAWMVEKLAKVRIVYPGQLIFVDGWPRNPGQGAMVDTDVARVIMLYCRTDVAISRQLARGDRAHADEEVTVRRRTMEQAALLEQGEAESWLRRLSGWDGSLNTTSRTAAEVLKLVSWYLRGERVTVS